MSPEDGLVSFDGNARTFHPSPLLSMTFTPVQWALMAEEDPWGPGVYTVFMVIDAHPLSVDGLEGLSGRLVWNETSVDLCGIDVRLRGITSLRVGDIFQTIEGCGPHRGAMQEAFDEFGLPELGCLKVTSGSGE
jgi:hypothetical protein